MSECCKSLSIWRFGVAVGLTWALGLLALALINMCWTWGAPFISLMSSLYPGYDVTVLGAFTGAAWAFADGFIGGAMVALFYNLLGCCRGCCKKD